MFATAAMAIVLVAQQAGASILAVYPDDPTTWSLEYPTRIGPYVTDYYDCLRSGSYVIGSGETFETQYRQDIPRCAEKGTKLEAEANAALAEKGADATPPSEVALIFERARRIHIARGQSLDITIRSRLITEPAYGQVRDRIADGVTPAVDTQCIGRIDSLVAQRQAYMDAEELRVEALVAKDEYSTDDQREIGTYQNQLQRYNSLIMIEQRRCPAAGEQEIADFDNEPNDAQD